jgi:hypothetical protein
MPRFNRKTYRIQVSVLMTIYVAIMLLLWPHARGMADVPLKIALALAPAFPVVGVIWLMAKRVMHSDELEQRVHMAALSMATGVVAVLSLVGGFLCAAGALHLDGDVLIWVFPTLGVSYGVARSVFARHYGSAGCG